jgi:hypothetical protein
MSFGVAIQSFVFRCWNPDFHKADACQCFDWSRHSLSKACSAHESSSGTASAYK